MILKQVESRRSRRAWGAWREAASTGRMARREEGRRRGDAWEAWRWVTVGRRREGERMRSSCAVRSLGVGMGRWRRWVRGVGGAKGLRGRVDRQERGRAGRRAWKGWTEAVAAERCGREGKYDMSSAAWRRCLVGGHFRGWRRSTEAEARGRGRVLRRAARAWRRAAWGGREGGRAGVEGRRREARGWLRVWRMRTRLKRCMAQAETVIHSTRRVRAMRWAMRVYRLWARAKPFKRGVGEVGRRRRGGRLARLCLQGWGGVAEGARHSREAGREAEVWSLLLRVRGGVRRWHDRARAVSRL